MPQTRLRVTAEAHRDADYARVIYEHEAIYAPIESVDPQSASAAMRTHLANSRHRWSKPAT